MILSSQVRLPFPRPLVYATYRDHLLEVVPYLENVRAIEITSRRDEVGRTYLVNEWHGGGEIPAAVRSILSEAMLSWTDLATWTETDFTSDWCIKPHAFTEAVHCAGQHRFLADGNATVIESRGELTIDPHRLHGIPWMLTGMISGVVEDFLGKKIGPNFLQVAEGVQHYLERQVEG